jgi:peroxiredoxin Q/BCP
MTISLFVAAVAAVSFFSFTVGSRAETLKAGDAAPKLEFKDQDGKSYNLADFVGKQAVILYFYPKDNTPGCTKEACGFRDRMEALKKSKAQVFGVSFDSAASHKKFIEKYDLNFPLVVDESGIIIDAFGARRAPGQDSARRVSFLIGFDGKIAHVTESSSAETHLEEMRTALEKLSVK